MEPDERYRELETRIEAARRSPSAVLNLALLGLSAVPEALSRLTKLRWLDLSGNRLTSLPEPLGGLTRLRLLHLSSNRLASLPEWLGGLAGLQTLYLSDNRLAWLPESLGGLTQLVELSLARNRLTSLPESLGGLRQLGDLRLSSNQLTSLPESLGGLTRLRELHLDGNQLRSLPESLGGLTRLRTLDLSGNQLTSLPESLAQLDQLEVLRLHDNPLNPELAAAYEEGLDAVMQYLRAQAEAQIVLNEAKLILIGEGDVGKSCLLGALRGDPWVERDTTHGIEIKLVPLADPETGREMTLNGWDFGGQRVYRPTHQLFFSAPAVYLVVWKPREGSQQGFVKEWINLVKHREPGAKILVVATHGGPGQRQPDIDRQEIWDLFGRETVIDFFHVESKPDKKTGLCRGIDELKNAIARTAAELPEMGRRVPGKWQQVRDALRETDEAYLPVGRVFHVCREHGVGEEEARLFLRISRTLGDLTYYEYDPTLCEIVILKPDWLATAISFVLDDEVTRRKHGLVDFERLSHLWNDSGRPAEHRYPPELHQAFLRLMERFDLSYRVALGSAAAENITSLIAQLVPDARPELDLAWPSHRESGDEEQVQICRVVDARTGQSASAEGLFYQLIVRLHKYSLGRANYEESVHWQRGLVLDDDYNGRALMEHVGYDVRITVRAPYPERFLSVLANEVRWLVDSFWEGLRCEVMVPCVHPCGKGEPGLGLFEVGKLIAFRKQGMEKFPCTVFGCDQAQDIDCLLRNAPESRRVSAEQLLAGDSGIMSVLAAIRQHDRDSSKRVLAVHQDVRRVMSQVDDAFTGLMQTLTDEAKEGPRLFSLEPVKPNFWLGKPTWISEEFRLTLWCEHARLPLPALNGDGDESGVYKLELPRAWFVRAAPFLKLLAGTLSMVLPIASSMAKLDMSDEAYKLIEKQLDSGQKCAESAVKGVENATDWLDKGDAPDLEHGDAIRAQGAALRELQAFLKKEDPGFGGLVRVQNKRREFLWVHPKFAGEY